MLATVVICTFNRAQYLPDVLESLSGQTFPVEEFEIVVVDDGSTDHTEQVCREASTRMPHLIYISMGSNSGLSAAGNRAISEAKGKYLLFTDDDCLPDPEWVAKMCEALQNAPIVAGAMISPTGNYFRLCHNIAQFFPFMPGHHKKQLDFIAGANMGFHAWVLKENNGFDPDSVIPDMEFILRVRAKGYAIAYAPEAVITHNPQRVTLSGVLSYSASHAKHTIILRNRFRELLKTPFILRSPLLILLFSPLIALKTTVSIYTGNKRLRGYLHTLPVVYLIKMAWCWGAAQGLHSYATESND